MLARGMGAAGSCGRAREAKAPELAHAAALYMVTLQPTACTHVGGERGRQAQAALCGGMVTASCVGRTVSAAQLGTAAALETLAKCISNARWSQAGFCGRWAGGLGSLPSRDVATLRCEVVRGWCCSRDGSGTTGMRDCERTAEVGSDLRGACVLGSMAGCRARKPSRPHGGQLPGESMCVHCKFYDKSSGSRIQSRKLV